MAGTAPIEIEITGIANGGEGVGRDAEGRVVFVAGALPGERVEVDLVESRARHARGQLVEVVVAGADRVAPSCPHVAEGCGGCDWQHVATTAQGPLRERIAHDVLERIARVVDPVVAAGPPLPGWALRTTMRAAVVDGRAGFRQRRSHDTVAVGSCAVAHPLVEEVLTDGRFGSAEEITVRVGARTGERSVLVPPGAEVAVPRDVRVVATDGTTTASEPWIHEVAAGRSWRVSPASFFQSSPEGAEALVEVVGAAVDAHAGPDASLVDLCGGVGLFAGALGRPGTVLVESSRTALADAEVNLADLDVQLVRSRLERWRPDAADVVVADPPRAGLGRAGVARVERSGASLVVLVSCDAGSLGRDVGLLNEAGFVHESSVVLDLFPQTSHLEVVTTLTR